MKMIHKLLVTLTLVIQGRQCYNIYPSSDGCNPNVYRVLDDSRRHVLYSLNSQEDPLCDDLLPPGWYRFMENGSSRVMSNTCPGQHVCGTESPVWLDPATLVNMTGTMSSTSMMTGSACVSWSWPGMSDCCLYTLPVTLRKCDGFWTYYLQPTQACNVAYCMDTGHMANHHFAGRTF